MSASSPNSASVQSPDRTTSSLAIGDAAAQRGEWTSALDAWMSMIDDNDADGARSRVRWLAREGVNHSSFPGSDARPVRKRIMAMGTCALIGFLVLYGFRDSASVIVSTVVWLCISTSAALAILVAHRIGSRESSPLSQAEIARARAVATALDREPPVEGTPNVRR